ncbi:MAG: DMT family transporter [Bacteroidales bacterium]|nr:DMT family transporter [Bacteroidales bacterium]
MVKNKEILKGHLAVFFTSLIFGINAPAVKVVLKEAMNPFALSLIRMICATAVFWVASLFVPREKVEKKDMLVLVLASVFGITLNQGGFVLGLSMTTPVDALLLNSLVPITTMFIAAAILKEPITFKKAFGVAVACSGAVLLILRDTHPSVAAKNPTLGNIIIILSGIAYAIYFTAFMRVIKKYSPLTLMKWLFTFAAVMCTPFWYKDVLAVKIEAFDTMTVTAFLFVLIFATFVAYLLLPFGQKRLRPTLVSMYQYTQPVVATIISVSMGMNSFGWDKAAATLLIFSGVYIVNKSKSRVESETVQQ